MQIDSHKFLFFIERELHLPLLTPLINYIAENRLGEIGIYSVPFQDSSNNSVQRGLRTEILYKNISKSVSLSLVDDPFAFAPDITFMADFSYQYTEGLGKIVNIGHGTISKGWFFTNKNISLRENCADLICVPGFIHKDILSQKVDTKIIVTGMPKLDRLFLNYWDRNKELQNLGLNPENKTVLFAPTFNPELTILNHLKSDLSQYFPTFVNIIVKLHGATKNIWRDNLSATSNNFYFAEDDDVTKYIAISDALISDVSSVIFEFAATGKPVLQFDSPTQKDYINYDENDLEYKFRSIGHRFSDPQKITELLFKTFTNNEKSNKEISDQFISVKDGTATQKVVSESIKLLDAPKTISTMFIFNYNDESKRYIKNRFSNRNHLIFVPPFEIESKGSIYEFIYEYFDKINTDNIIIYNANYVPSPLIVDLLSMKYKENIGMVVPLLAGEKANNLQHIKFYFNNSDNLPIKQLGFQLNYSSIGQSIDIDFPTDNFVLTNKKYFKDSFSFLRTQKSIYFELLKRIYDDNKNVILSLDSLIYQNKIEHKEDEEINSSLNMQRAFEALDDGKTEYNLGSDELMNNPSPDRNETQEESFLKREIEADPFNETKILDLIHYYIKEEKFESAEVYCNMIPDNDEAKLLAGISLKNQELLQQAYEKISEVNHENLSQINKLTYFIERSKLQLKLGIFENVDIYLKYALDIDENNLDALLSISSFYILKNLFKDAQRHLEKAYNIAPNDEKVNMGLAIVSQSENKFEQAKDFYLKILRFNPQNMNAIKGLLTCSYAMQSFYELEAILKDYTSNHPGDINMLFIYASILCEMKKFSLAKEYIKKVKILNPDFSGLEELENKILKG